VDGGSSGNAHKAKGLLDHAASPDLSLRGGDSAPLHHRDLAHLSVALVVEREEEGHLLKVQWPVYFISKVLFDSKARYPRV
jgi:hypothetical protein